ncbi:MAG TPA: O-antigen ligase family protein [Abditibacterium sp.]
MLSSRPAPEVAAPDLASGPDSLAHRFAFGALLLLLGLGPLQLSGFWPGSYDFWPQTLFLLLSAVVALMLAVSPGSMPRFDAPALLLLAFLGWSAISVATGVYRHDSYLEMARLLGAWTTFFVLRVVWNSRRGVWIVGAWCLGLSWVCLLALLDYAQTHNTRQFGTFDNPNFFANALALTLPIALVFPIALWRRTRHALWIIGALPFLACAAGLIVTSSKGGFLAALLGLLTTISLLIGARRAQVGAMLRRHRVVFAMGSVVFLLMFGFLATKTLLPRLQQAGAAGDNSSAFRPYLWRSTLQMTAARPLTGFGPANWRHANPQFASVSYTRHAHQSWLQIAAESGWPALILLLGAIVSALKIGVSRSKSNDWPLVAGAGGAVVAMLIHGSVDSGLITTSVLLLFAAALALLTAHEREARIENSRLNPFWLGATLLLALGGAQSHKAASGEFAMQRAEEFAENGAPNVAVERGREAVGSDDTSARLWLRLGFLQEGSGGDGTASFERAAQLQPTNGLNWANLARAAQRHGGSPAEVERFYARALEESPNDTKIRLERAGFRLDSKNSAGYDDLEKIIALWSAPLGLYAPNEFNVNLDFARATRLLAPQLKRRGQNQRLQTLVTRALADCARAQGVAAQNRDLLRAMGTSAAPDANADLENLTQSLRALQTS